MDESCTAGRGQYSSSRHLLPCSCATKLFAKGSLLHALFPLDCEAPRNDDDLSGLGWFDISQARFALYDYSSLLSLPCTLAVAQCIVISPICGWVAVRVFVCGSVTTITLNCVHRSSPNWVCS